MSPPKVLTPSSARFGEALRSIRKSRGLSLDAMAAILDTSKSYLSDLENGKRPMPPGATLDRWADLLDVVIEALLPGEQVEPVERLARIIGKVGGNPDDSILYTTASDVYDYAPIPPGGSEKSVGLEVAGHSMRWVADDGALIYFEDQRNPPAEDMLGAIVIVETEDEQVLIKRLLRGSEPGLYDLESQNGATLTDRRIRWAADITAIVPPKQARKIIKRGEAA